MRTTITIDDELLATAKRYAKLDETSAMVREALTAYVQREAARRLARLGGSDPNANAAPRKRPWIDRR
jgi:Arc/MetJ family transcription regulator